LVYYFKKIFYTANKKDKEKTLIFAVTLQCGYVA